MQIFIAESNEDLRVGLQMILHRDAGLHVIGMAVQADGLLAQLDALRAEVLILDWRLSGAVMPEFVGDICNLESPPKIIVLSAKASEEQKALTAGADAFINKSRPPEELLEALHSMVEGSVDSTKQVEKGD
jgi:DNA-binding NarL/FixJ family response regulator